MGSNPTLTAKYIRGNMSSEYRGNTRVIDRTPLKKFLSKSMAEEYKRMWKNNIQNKQVFIKICRFSILGIEKFYYLRKLSKMPKALKRVTYLRDCPAFGQEGLWA